MDALGRDDEILALVALRGDAVVVVVHLVRGRVRVRGRGGGKVRGRVGVAIGG